MAGAAGDGLQAAGVAAAARARRRRRGRATCPRSPAAPCAPRRSAPSLMMPAADAGGDLDEHQVRVSGQCGEVLAERHHVDVVVDERRRAELGGEVAGHVEAVPAGHDRRVDRAPGGVLDRPGQPDADAGEVLDSHGREQLARQCRRRGRAPTSGPSAMSRSSFTSASTEPARSVTASRAWVAPRSAAEHDAHRRVEREARGRPAAGGRGLARVPDEAAGQQRVDPRGHRGAGQPGASRPARRGCGRARRAAAGTARPFRRSRRWAAPRRPRPALPCAQSSTPSLGRTAQLGQRTGNF